MVAVVNAQAEREVCDRKVAYPTYKIAKQRAAKVKARVRKDITVYLCQDCDGWHLTSQPQR